MRESEKMFEDIFNRGYEVIVNNIGIENKLKR
jgi:hypothetical protein